MMPEGKSNIQQKETLFYNELDLNLRKKLVKCYIWSVSLYSSEASTLRKAEQKYLASFVKWCLGSVGKSSGPIV
jgi:hypothetical protein